MSEKEKMDQPRSAKYRRHFFFLFFILISIGMWLTNKLAQEYVATLQFTPVVRNSQLAAIYQDKQDNTLYLQVKASGFYLMRVNLFGNKPELVFDIKELKLGSKKDTVLRLPSVLLKDRFPDYMEKDFKVMQIEPDTLYFRISNNATKRVPVQTAFTLSFEREYRQSGPIKLYPDSVTLSGNERDLENIHSVSTSPYSYPKLNAPEEGVIKLNTIRNVICKPEKVRYVIPVARCTQASISLTVTAKNTPERTSLLLFPPQVQVKYTIPIHVHADIKQSNFEAVVDFNDTDGLLGRKLRVALKQKPEQAFDIQIEPEFVEFIIQKN